MLPCELHQNFLGGDPLDEWAQVLWVALEPGSRDSSAVESGKIREQMQEFLTW
jgi:hypothetical protein